MVAHVSLFRRAVVAWEVPMIRKEVGIHVGVWIKIGLVSEAFDCFLGRFLIILMGVSGDSGLVTILRSRGVKEDILENHMAKKCGKFHSVKARENPRMKSSKKKPVVKRSKKSFESAISQGKK
jgi:hypothetical protein